MAYDKIITVRSRLDHCVDYVLNHEKTDMAAVLDYIGRTDKNALPDGRSVLETAINCDLESAYQDMQETKRRWGKPGGVLGYHLIHAFAPGEVTPKQAHEIGVEFASRLLGDRYEAVISTHLDRDHLHCHILFNSVSFVDGAKYKNTFKDYYGDIRDISNEVSRTHGLSVIEPGEGGRHYAEWDAEAQGRPTLRSLVRQDIDAAIASAYTMKTFWQQLEELGYTCTQYAFSDSNDIAAVCQTAADNSDVLYIPTDNSAASNTPVIDNICRGNIPVFCGEEGICAGCGVATLSISYYDIGYKTGEMAADILTGKADVAEMPIEYAPQFVKKYNPVTCEALGLTPPEGYEAIAAE